MFSKLYLFFFDLGRVLCAPLLLFYRVKKRGTNGARVKTAELPRGAVYVCNHVGFSDPMVLGCAFAPRRLFFLVTTQATNAPVRGFLLRHCGCIPIDRAACDIDAIRRCTALLKAGGSLCIFPQGHLQHSGALQSIEQGASLIAAQAGVPIVPMYSDARRRPWQRRRLVIGDAIDPRPYGGRFPSAAKLSALSDAVLAAMLRCKACFEEQENQK